MVVGYMCTEHGFVRDCGVSKSGERLCKECGNAVTGVTGRARSTRRSPPEDSSMASGDIEWTVKTRGGYTYTMAAFDIQAAGELAVSQLDMDPQRIKEVTPTERRYRA